MTSHACQELDFSTWFVFWLNKAPVLQHCTCPVGVWGGEVTRDIPTLIFLKKLHIDSVKWKRPVCLWNQIWARCKTIRRMRTINRSWKRQPTTKILDKKHIFLLHFFSNLCSFIKSSNSISQQTAWRNSLVFTTDYLYLRLTLIWLPSCHFPLLWLTNLIHFSKCLF